ncbi:hypothetical protein F7725_009284, partial [Dissostichus mawsoni]
SVVPEPGRPSAPPPVSIVSPSDEPWSPRSLGSGPGLWRKSSSGHPIGSPSASPASPSVGLRSPGSGSSWPSPFPHPLPFLISSPPLSDPSLGSGVSEPGRSSLGLISTKYLGFPALLVLGQIFGEHFLLLFQLVLELLDKLLLLLDKQLPAQLFLSQVFGEPFLLFIQIVHQLLDSSVLQLDFALQAQSPFSHPLPFLIQPEPLSDPSPCSGVSEPALLVLGQIFGEHLFLLSHLVLQLFDIRLAALVIFLLLHPFECSLQLLKLSLPAQVFPVQVVLLLSHFFFLTLPDVVFLCQVLGELFLALKELFISSLQQV